MTPARIFVVEDDQIVAMDIEQQLKWIGHEVVGMTTSGEDVQSLVLATQPDLVLMDIRLEGKVDGIDAANMIREHCRLPVVFLTAYADDETVHRASLAEPFGYLLKPFENSQLRTVVEMALYKHAAEQKLRESERRFVAILSSIGDAVIATDDQARVTFMNPVAQALTGWSERAALGLSLAEVFRIINEDTHYPVEDPVGKVLRSGTAVGLANHTVLLARDGREIPIDDCGAPICDDDGGVTGAVVVFRDITERRAVDEALSKARVELAQVSRMSTMGELAASIAHEVNQPLTAILSGAEACLQWMDREPPNLYEARKAARNIIKSGSYAGDVIARIRAQIRNSSTEAIELDLNEIVTDSLDLMRAELRRNDICLDTKLSARLNAVSGDRIQLRQVIVNLVINGIEAMSSVVQRTRILRVSTQSDAYGAPVVAIEDSGTGLEPEHLDRIFNVLFTTKRDGMGMGLSICRTIVESHGGRLSASPNTPHGSVFRFTLPAAAGSMKKGRAI